MGSGLKVINILNTILVFLLLNHLIGALYLLDSVLFDYFSSTSTNLVILVLESFMTVKPDQPWKSISGDMLTLNLKKKYSRTLY